MSGEGWDEFADLTARLSHDDAISPAQADMLRRLVAEVGALTRGQPGERIVVRTAVPLTPDERSQLEELLARRFGPGRRLAIEVDPQILGGIWLRVGNQIIDGSLRGRLEALRRQLTAA